MVRRGSQGSAAWGAMEEMDPPGQDPPGQDPAGQGPPGVAADARDVLTPLHLNAPSVRCLESRRRRRGSDERRFCPGFRNRGLCWRQEAVSHPCEGGSWSWGRTRSRLDISGSLRSMGRLR